MGAVPLVNIACDFAHPGGFGTHGRSFAAALDRRVPIAVLQTGRSSERSPFTRLPPANDRPTVWIGPPATIADLPGHPKIAWVTWETTRVPKPYIDLLSTFDVLWAPSAFTKGLLDRALGGIRPVYVVPEGVNTDVFRPAMANARRWASKPFRFLTVGKWESRKAHDYLIRAYTQAFAGEKDVQLILRLTLSKKDQSLTLPVSRNTIPQVMLSPPCAESALADLYRSASAFVLATRGEAWGLPILEAMATGLPCIVTDYGGHLDYCTADNSFLVPYDGLVPVQDPVYFPPVHDWGLWAEPSVDGIADTLRLVWGDPEEALERGARARQAAVEHWTWDNSARIAERLLRNYA